MSLSVGWRIARNTSVVYSSKILEELKEKDKGAAEKGAAEDRGQTGNTGAKPPSP